MHSLAKGTDTSTLESYPRAARSARNTSPSIRGEHLASVTARAVPAQRPPVTPVGGGCYTSPVRTALVSALVVGGVVAWLNIGRTLSNADFIYMCAAAQILKTGALLASPYFPPGYPLLLWCVMQAGLSSLNAGAVLAAAGTGLTAGAVAYIARFWRCPPAVALCLGLLAASLPDVFQVAMNPHLDALYTGLAAVFIAAALRSLGYRPHTSVAPTATVAALAAVVLLSLRYHAVLLVIPAAVVMLCSRKARPAGAAVLIVSAVALGWVYWSLWVCTGRIETAAVTQVYAGESYRRLGEEKATHVIFDNYPAWRSQVPRTVDPIMMAAAAQANWLEFLTRKAVLLGAAAWLLILLIRRRMAWESAWLLPFIALYTLAVSVTYFTPRASALTEAAGLMLLAAALGSAFAPFAADLPSHRRRRGYRQANVVDPAILGGIAVLLLLGGIGYNAWRERTIVLDWRQRGTKLTQLSREALSLAGGDRRKVCGAMGLVGWPVTPPSNLPSATYSRFWLDDPAISPAFDSLIPRYSPTELLTGRTPVQVIVLIEEVGGRPEQQLLAALPTDASWREVPSPVPGARIWVRR